jgi:GNAT superfamily N-acetyltransferase
MIDELTIRSIQDDDRDWIIKNAREHWGAPYVISRGVRYDLDALPGYIALRDGERLGLVTYEIGGKNCQIVSLDSLVQGHGVGSRLIAAVKQAATMANCNRIWLITTNDNLDALRFYQKRGFVLFALYRNAIQESRTLKPEISLLGDDGIPIRDEIELEFLL